MRFRGSRACNGTLSTLALKRLRTPACSPHAQMCPLPGNANAGTEYSTASGGSGLEGTGVERKAEAGPSCSLSPYRLAALTARPDRCACGGGAAGATGAGGAAGRARCFDAAFF